MSRFRTDLRAFPRRKSSVSRTKLPPVQNEYGSPSESPHHWATDMIVGLPLKTTTPTKDVKVKRSVTSPKETIKNMVNSVGAPKKRPPSVVSSGVSQAEVDKLNQEITTLKITLQELIDKIAKLEKENEVIHIQT